MSAHDPQDLGLPPFAHCQRCNGETYSRIVLLDRSPHWGRRECIDCGGYIRWETKPDGERKHRPAPARRLVHRFSRGFCEMCLRREDELPHGQQLEAHHVIPFSASEAAQFGFDGPGPDTRENTWILCTPCHLKVDHERTYTCLHPRKMRESLAEAAAQNWRPAAAQR